VLSRGAVVLAVDALALAREMPSLFPNPLTKKMTASRCVFSRSARARYRTRDARSLEHSFGSIALVFSPRSTF
jgi:hypothetical protein